MNWYIDGDTYIQATPVYRDNVIDVNTLTLSGDVYNGTMRRRYSIIDKTNTGWVCKIISLFYDTPYDSYNLKPLEPLKKYLQGEYVTLLEMVQPLDWSPESWNGTVRIFNEH